MKRPLTFSPARESVDALDAGARAAAGELRELQAHKATNGYKSPRSAKMAEGFGGGGPYRNHLGDSEITRRAASLSAAEWELLRRLAPEPLAIKRGTAIAKVARRLQLLAFVWPKRAPWWTITKHGRKALEAHDPMQQGETD